MLEPRVITIYQGKTYHGIISKKSYNRKLNALVFTIILNDGETYISVLASVLTFDNLTYTFMLNLDLVN